jgi:menaquinone-dependent protoporphyrinogen oxidase
MLSGAIHNGQWLPEAAAAVTRLASALTSLPVSAFSASSIGATSCTVSPRLARSLHARTPLPKAVQQLAELTDLHGHRVFTGAVRRGDWAGLGSVVFRLMGRRYGDARDWVDITAWADRVANGLARHQTLKRAATRHPLIEYLALLGAQHELGQGRRPLQG